MIMKIIKVNHNNLIEECFNKKYTKDYLVEVFLI